MQPVSWETVKGTKMVSVGRALGHPSLYILPLDVCLPATREQPQASPDSQGLELEHFFCISFKN